MEFYPYNSPIILTDTIFLAYGGMTGTSTQLMRDAAYLMAEEQVTEYIDSFLLPTSITGTYFSQMKKMLVLDYGNVISIDRVVVSSINWANSCEINSVTGCHAIRGDGKLGIIDIDYLCNCVGCGSVVSMPYNVTISYTSGLPSGTSYHSNILMALVAAAQINLNELDISLANESTADIGIETFSNQSYSEKRLKGYNTVFGNSAMANRIARLLRKYRTKPAIGFH